jgi:ABC-type uncharacterized transport system ATPase subunit
MNEINDLIGASGELIMVNLPETGLTLSNQVTVANILIKLSQENLVIVNTNSIPIIRTVNSVYCLDSMKQYVGSEYIKESLTSHLR